MIKATSTLATPDVPILNPNPYKLIEHLQQTNKNTNKMQNETWKQPSLSVSVWKTHSHLFGWSLLVGGYQPPKKVRDPNQSPKQNQKRLRAGRRCHRLFGGRGASLRTKSLAQEKQNIKESKYRNKGSLWIVVFVCICLLCFVEFVLVFGVTNS